MNKRIEQKKQRSGAHRRRLKQALAVFFCIALLVFFINAADMSTRRMIMCNDDKYALAVSLPEENMLRVDIAGEKLMINVEPVVRLTEYIVAGSKKCYKSIIKAIMAKSGS